MIINKNGQDYEFHLSLDKILEAEREDPEYSFLAEMADLGNSMRLLPFDRMMRFCGHGLGEMLSAGFKLDELADIFSKILEEMGFISADSESGDEN